MDRGGRQCPEPRGEAWGVPGTCSALGHSLFARNALSRVTEARQLVGDKAAGRGKPEPRRGPGPEKAMSSARPAPCPSGFTSGPRNRRGSGSRPGSPTRAEGSTAAMTGGRAPVRPAARVGSTPSPAPSPGRPPLSVGSPAPGSGLRASGWRTYSPPQLRLPAACRLASLD